MKCVSLFSGGGGLDLGLESVGFETVFATDIDYHSCITLRESAKAAAARKKPFLREASVLEADVVKLDGKEILKAANLKKGELDLLAGGPPCQAFSVFGKRKGLEDPRGGLSYHYLRILADLSPQAFVFENVFGLLTIEDGDIFKNLCERLSNPAKGLHYKVSVHRLNAVNYGVPQFRDRVFIIGDREERSVTAIKTITSDKSVGLAAGQLPWRTVRDALRGMPKIGRGGLANHVGRDHGQDIIDRYASMRAGERDSKTRINKLDLSRPSFTIIVGSDKGGGKGHIHHTEPREVTPRESARIQCFPDWWGFSGTSRHPIRQVGNAVPSLLGAAVGNAIRKNIFGKREVPLESYLSTLDQEHLFPEIYASLAKAS
jgi:DNA (cytosine-5)-methyltransferase 1